MFIALKSLLQRLVAVSAVFLAAQYMLAGFDQAFAEAPERLTLKSTDRVFWKGKAGENFLILNVFAHESRINSLPSPEQNTLLLNTALVEGARTFGRPEHSQLKALSILFVSLKDMSEYGGSAGKWTEVGTATLLKDEGRVELREVKLKGELPSQIPTLPFPFEETSTITTPTGIRFLMPERVYVVAGTPQHFFYENLITTKEADEFVFIPAGNAVGMATINRRGLEFNPTDAHVGEHPLKIKVTDWEGKTVAEGLTTVVVTPAVTALAIDKADPIRILVIGHSLPSMYWPAYLADYLAGPGNPPVAFVGGIKYWYGLFPDFRNNPPLDTMYHQASPGYSVKTLLELYSDQPDANPNMPSQSPFLFRQGNAPATIDMKRYLDETLKGKAPHYILLNIGDNDTFNLNPEETDSAVEKEFIANMNSFLDHLREIAPQAIFGAVLPNTYNYSDRAFLHNYGDQYPRWKQLRNRQRYIEIMTSIAKTRGDLVIVPSNMVVDGIDGMAYNSGTHFNNQGARQFAGASYAWLRAQFTKQLVAGTAAQVQATSLKTGSTSNGEAAASARPGWLSRQYTRVKRIFVWQ